MKHLIPKKRNDSKGNRLGGVGVGEAVLDGGAGGVGGLGEAEIFPGVGFKAGDVVFAAVLADEGDGGFAEEDGLRKVGGEVAGGGEGMRIGGMEGGDSHIGGAGGVVGDRDGAGDEIGVGRGLIAVLCEE